MANVPRGTYPKAAREPAGAVILVILGVAVSLLLMAAAFLA